MSKLTELPLCACGCGEHVILRKGKPNKYIHGHQSKGIRQSEETKMKLSEIAKGRPGYWTGKKMPEEARKKMSESDKNRHPSEEHKKKISEALKDRVFSEETIQKFIGKKQTLETKIKKRETQIGSKGPGWKGGICTENQINRHSLFFKEWKRKVLERDNCTCQKCGTKNDNNNETQIQAHHIKPFAKYPELRYEINNGITLCKNCHKNEHRRILK